MKHNTDNIHSESIIIDGLNASVFDKNLFKRLQKGGITAVNVTASIFENFKNTMINIKRWGNMFAEYSDLIMPINNVQDIAKAKKSGKVGIILGFQNTSAIEEDIELLSIFKEVGVRIIQLTYNERNFVGDGCFERVDAGLTKFGLNIISKMNELGLLIDLSHVGPKTTMEAIKVSKKPVAITHSNPRALFDCPRNKTDEQIKLLASKEGVIGATFWPFFLKKGMDSTLQDYLDNIDYLVSLAGIDHVAIASDFFLNRSKEELQKFRAGRSRKPETVDITWPVFYPDGIRTPEEFPHITSGLLKRGYAIDEIKKIVGGNLIRVFTKVWR